MQLDQILEARTFDDRIYTADLSQLLAAGQVVTAVDSVAEDTGTLICSNPVVNTLPVTMPDGHIVPVGQAVQFEAACVTPSTALAGQQWVLLTIRVRVATNTDRAVEGTVRFFLCDTPGVNAQGCGC